jgi:sulfite reductase beta subunit-like hemoprotein
MTLLVGWEVHWFFLKLRLLYGVLSSSRWHIVAEVVLELRQ